MSNPKSIKSKIIKDVLDKITPEKKEERSKKMDEKMKNKYITEEDKALAKANAVNDVEYNAILTGFALKNEEIGRLKTELIEIYREKTSLFKKFIELKVEKEEEAISFGNFLSHNPKAAKAFNSGKGMEDVYEIFKQQDK
jgi:hypothetical protein